jgi:Icc protein
MRGVDTFESLQAVLRRAMGDGDPPDAILATGDLVHDETRAGYERLAAALGEWDMPVYCLAGNHDAPETMVDVMREPPFHTDGGTQLGNWTLIMLSSHVPGDDGGYLSEDELRFVETRLADRDCEHALICLHHQPVEMGSAWLDGVGLRNAEHFLNTLDCFTNVRGIVWGHVHQASDRRRKGVRLMSTPSTCFQFLPGSRDFALDTRPPGFRWLDLRDSGRIDTEVVWLEDTL